MTKTEYMREWRAKHPEYKEYMRLWREANRERIAESNRQYHKEHSETLNKRSMLWAKENPFEFALHQKVASANRRYPGRITIDDLRDVIALCGRKCHWCEKEITESRDFTLEHLRPINEKEHLRIACLACNAAKLPSNQRTRRLTLEERRTVARTSPRKREYDAAWKIENRDRVNAKQRERYNARLEEKRAYFREWQRKKRESA